MKAHPQAHFVLRPRVYGRGSPPRPLRPSIRFRPQREAPPLLPAFVHRIASIRLVAAMLDALLFLAAVFFGALFFAELLSIVIPAR